MEKDFEGVFRDIETKAPKELVREYGTPEGSKVREFVPFVHGYQMTIGPDGKPKVKEFGNVHGIGSSSKREHLVNIQTYNYKHRKFYNMLVHIDFMF